jgi:hypothetical protein
LSCLCACATPRGRERDNHARDRLGLADFLLVHARNDEGPVRTPQSWRFCSTLKRGSVVAPLVCTIVSIRLSSCGWLLYKRSVRLRRLDTTFYFRPPDRSPTQIAHGRGHPLDLLTGLTFPEILPQGIDVAMKRLHRSTSAATDAAPAVNARARW